MGWNKIKEDGYGMGWDGMGQRGENGMGRMEKVK